MSYFVDEKSDSDIMEIIKDDRRLLAGFSAAIGLLFSVIVITNPDVPIGIGGAASFGIVMAGVFFIVVRWLLNLALRRQNRWLVELCDREIAKLDDPNWCLVKLPAWLDKNKQ